MKKPFLFMTICSMVITITFTSCGPSKKLVASQAKFDKLQQENNNTINQLSACNLQVSSLKTENELSQNNLKVLSDESKMTIADQAKRLKNLQIMIQSQKDVMTKLKKSITDALLNYKTDELSVYIKDGNVYVSLQEKLLFTSGSDLVNVKGKEALKSLAQVLNSTKGITVLIEGHTDNVPIKTSQFKDNWDLSTARATSILRVLTKDYGYDSNLITASGRGEYHPVKSNETADGRASNRRTEIILSPDLNELFILLGQ